MLFRLLERHIRAISVVTFATIIYVLAAQGSQSVAPRHKRSGSHKISFLSFLPQTEQPKDQLLASWTVSLRPDSPETTNALLAAKAIDGATISKQAAFSFNDVVGPRTAEKGYQSGAMFQGGQIVSGVGGGVCIVSTALYNAALEAGLPILARSPHSAIVRYAPAGRDAAVASEIDLRFKNDTDFPITIKAKAEADALTISVYGIRPPGYHVQVLASEYKALTADQATLQDPTLQGFEPVTAQTCQDGYECTIVRKVIEDGKLVRREEISHDVHPARDGLNIAPMDAPSEPDNAPGTTPEPRHPSPAVDSSATKAAVAGAVMRSLFAVASSGNQKH